MPDLADIGTSLADWQIWLDRVLNLLGLSFSSSGLLWSAIQIAIVLAAFAGGRLISRLTTPYFESRIRQMQWRAGTLRAAAVVLRRLTIVYSAILLWFALSTIRAATWDSRSYFVALCAALVTAWAVISILSRIIRNRSIARIVALVGWTLVALSVLGILPEAMALFDSVALELNDFRISLLTVVQAILVLTILIWGAIFVSHIAERQLSRLEDFTPTARVLISKLLRFSLIVLALLIGLYAAGVDFTALTLISGAVGVGLGFGLQKVVSNLVSGIILLLDKSIKPGDVISVGDTFGWITSLNARYASVTMRDGREFLIPNEDLITQQVQNWSFQDPYVRLDIYFGVSYESDPHQVRKIAVEAAKTVPRVVKDHPQYKTACHIVGFGDSSVDFILRFFIADPRMGLTNVRGEVYLALWDTLKQNKIGIPYPHREVIMRDAVKD